MLNLTFYVYYVEELYTLLYKNLLETCIHFYLFENCFIFALSSYKTLLWLPNFTLKLPIWPGYHTFSKSWDAKDNKESSLTFS